MKFRKINIINLLHNKIPLYFNMKFKDIFLSVFIILVFIGLYLVTVASNGMKKIKKEWPLYRCNPVVMPFAHYFGQDPMENFTHCIVNIQSNMMSFFLAPIHFITSMLGDFGGVLSGAMQELRHLQNFIRNGISGITGDIFGIFSNILIQFQKLIMGIKDLISKIVGFAAVIVYLIRGQILLGESIWNGPIGQLMRALCFHRETPLKLKSGKVVKMKDVELGDILENGSEVKAVLRIKGDEYNPFYRIWSEKLNEYIYVTGEHHIRNDDNKFIFVQDYEKAEKTELYDNELSCLVTSDHLIPIGEYTFWDWED